MLSVMEHPLLGAIVVFLAAGIAGIAIAQLLRVSPILGFFIAGAAVGPASESRRSVRSNVQLGGWTIAMRSSSA